MYNTLENEKDGNGEEEDKGNPDNDKDQERIYKMEYEEAKKEFGGPEEGEFEDHTKSLWTIFEEDTDNDDYPMEEDEEEMSEYFLVNDEQRRIRKTISN